MNMRKILQTDNPKRIIEVGTLYNRNPYEYQGTGLYITATATFPDGSFMAGTPYKKTKALAMKRFNRKKIEEAEAQLEKDIENCDGIAWQTIIDVAQEDGVTILPF